MKETGEFRMFVYEGPKAFWMISPDLCKGCGLCPEKCPTKVINWSEDLGIYGTPMVFSAVKGCIACQNCQMVCPDAAIKVIPKKNLVEGELAEIRKQAQYACKYEEQTQEA